MQMLLPKVLSPIPDRSHPMYESEAWKATRIKRFAPCNGSEIELRLFQYAPIPSVLTEFPGVV
jgi:hypothetical protein